MARTARCYCGASRLTFSAEPVQVVYCHCEACRRWTGAATPVLVAFKDADIVGLDALGAGRSFAQGVNRWNCTACGSPLLGRFDYVPGQSWVPHGVIEDAQGLAPTFHCFADRAHDWVPVDDLARSHGTGRDALNTANDG